MDAAPHLTPLVVLVTAPDLTVARALAASVVERRLAACVNLVPGLESVYRWENAVERAEEVQLVIKTTAERLGELEAHVAEQHPYDVPEFIALEAVHAHAAYLQWWRESCRGPGPTA